MRGEREREGGVSEGERAREGGRVKKKERRMRKGGVRVYTE